MRKYLFGTLFLLAVTAFGQVRTDSLIDFDWKFLHENTVGGQLFSLDDRSWKLVQLPHDASIYGPFLQDSLNSNAQNGFRPRQQGWYRKELTLEKTDAGRRYFLYFEGIYRDATVYFNEQQVAHQLNGFEAFEVDITGLIHSGTNLIALHYDNTDKESSRWYNGEGIYRDVWLKVRNATHVTDHGTYVTTPVITAQAAEIAVQTEVQHDAPESAEVTLVSVLRDPAGKEVASRRSVVPLAIGEKYVFSQTLHVADPERWSPDLPQLYTLVSTVWVSGRKADEVATDFGIRTVEFDPDHGLLLNGEKVLVKGVNLHHDLGPLGAAAFQRGYERRLEGLKKLGCNAIRLAHNPHDPYILDWCDRHGMLVFDEAFDKWGDQFFGAGNAFEDHWRSSLEAFIRRDRNHPSVFIWSVGNETHQQRSAKANFGIDQMKAMADFVHQLEPTRSVTCGQHPSRKSGAYRTENYYREGPPEMEFYMDVVSTNYREEFWPIDHANYPQLSFILSEAQVGNLGNEWFNFNHDYAVGMFYWGGTDYIGESFGWPAKGWPNGIIDWNDHWKPFSYYIQSLYSAEPMVYIAAYDPDAETEKYWNEVNLRFQPMFSHWNWSGRDSVRLMTFSNAEEVELLLNGVSLGKKIIPDVYHTKNITAFSAEEYDPDHPVNVGPELHRQLEWVVPYAPGILEAVARTDGVEVDRFRLQTAGPPHHLLIEPDRPRLAADGLDLAYITVRVVDEQGIQVPDAQIPVSFQVKGAGTIAGVGTGDVLSDEPFQASHRTTFQGTALLIVRAGRSPGTIHVKISAEGLVSGKSELTVIASDKMNPVE